MSQHQLYIAYDPIYAHPLPEGHRFPMRKYELIPAQLLYEQRIQPEWLHSSNPCNINTAELVHTKEYVNKLLGQTLSDREQRQIGFPQSPMLTQRELIITQGTINCAVHALEHQIAFNVAGGTHHAFADRGEGFCLLNDFAVAAAFLLNKQYIKQALVIDLDVHQGNGTAKIFSTTKEVFTFSMHGQHNYPFRKETSDLDLALEDGTDTNTYLSLLYRTLPDIIKQVQPDIAFYLSGVDILSTDKFGKLNVTQQGCRMRDRFVFQTLQAAGIPCTVAMGGGYSPLLNDIVTAHCATYEEAMDVYQISA